MALIRVEFRLAPRYRPGVMAAHGRRDQRIELAMPKADRHTDGLEREIPFTAIEASIERRAARARAKGFAAAFEQDVAQAGTSQGKTIAFRQTVRVLYWEGCSVEPPFDVAQRHDAENKSQAGCSPGKTEHKTIWPGHRRRRAPRFERT